MRRIWAFPDQADFDEHIDDMPCNVLQVYAMLDNAQRSYAVLNSARHLYAMLDNAGI